MKKRFLKVLAVSMLPAVLLGTVTSCGDSNSGDIIEVSRPKGDKGETGNGISSIEKTSSDGLKDIYTIKFTDGSITTFIVTNGNQGIQGIQGEPGKDGHTPVITIGENGNWYIDGQDTGKPSSISGETSKGISSIEKTSSDGLNDIYTITFTDGSTTTFTVTNGKDGVAGEQGIQGIQGEPGKDGHTPVITIGENGNWYIDGEDTGRTSLIKGEIGNGISSIEKTSSDGLKDIYTITFTDGSTTIFTVTNGKDGIDGIQGEPGKDGHTPIITIGENGNWYIDGEDTGRTSLIKGEIGNGISSIEKTSSDGLKDIYTITFTDGSTTIFTVTNGKDGIDGIQGEPGKDGHTPIITIGENGNWYVDGQDTGKVSLLKGDKGEKGDKGDDGLSAYEIYKKYHPEYQGTEEDWINDLAEGKLNSRVTISFDTNGGNNIKPVTISYGSLLSSIDVPIRNG